MNILKSVLQVQDFVVSLFKPAAFLTFLRPSPISLLKFPGFMDVCKRLEIRICF